MKDMRSRSIGMILVITTCLLACGSAWAQLRVGTSAVKITPPAGTPMAGYYFARGSEDVIDDLFAKVAVLDDGGTKVALVVCDLITLPRTTVLEARQLIEQQTGIPGSHVMMSATHTHTGPSLARDSVRDNQDGGSGDPARNYTLELPKRIAQAVVEAHGKLTPVTVSYAREHEHRLSFCRRFWMKDGTVGWNPGKLNPNIIRPVSPIDPEVGVVYFATADKKPLLTYVNFALHADTTGGSRISADYPGVLASRLADCTRPEHDDDLRQRRLRQPQPHQRQLGRPADKAAAEATRLGTILAGRS